MKDRKPTSRQERASEIKDEPDAEERFKGILKRTLNTPPPRKREAKQPKPQKR